MMPSVDGSLSVFDAKQCPWLAGAMYPENTEIESS